MIVVDVKLDQYGLGEKITPLARVLIHNDGTGTDLRGNYYTCAFRKGMLSGKPQRIGRVKNHPRKSAHVLTLLRKSLEAMGY